MLCSVNSVLEGAFWMLGFFWYTFLLLLRRYVTLSFPVRGAVGGHYCQLVIKQNNSLVQL